MRDGAGARRLMDEHVKMIRSRRVAEEKRSRRGGRPVERGEGTSEVGVLPTPLGGRGSPPPSEVGSPPTPSPSPHSSGAPSARREGNPSAQGGGESCWRET
jgi:hypothetical protein